MALKIPQNQIITKYTDGGEYIITDTKIRYQGYYYEVNGKAYTGKEYNVSGSQSLTKITPETYNNIPTSYTSVSNVKIDNFIPPSYIFNLPNIDYRIVKRYFYTKKNTNPIIIKEINKDNFNQVSTNPLYNTLILSWNVVGGNDDALESADKVFPGIKLFLSGEEPLDSYIG